MTLFPSKAHLVRNSKFSRGTPSNLHVAGGKKGVAGGSVMPVLHSEVTCPICNGKHFPAKCKASVQPNQIVALLRKKNYCSNCLKLGHDAEKCTVTITCFNCKGDHHRVLCPNTVATFAVNQLLISGSRAILPTGHVKLVNQENQCTARFLLDSGAERTFITAECAAKLNLKPMGTEKFLLHVFEEEAKLANFTNVTFEVQLPRGENLTFNALVSSKITGKEFPLLSEEIRNTLREPAEHRDGPARLGILFNAADAFRIIQNVVRVSEGCTVLETIFGSIPVREYGRSSIARN